jgi:hypothetical protein
VPVPVARLETRCGFLEGNMNCDTALFKSSTKDTAKRKLFDEQVDSMDNESQNACAKRRRVEGSGSNTGNDSSQTELEVMVFNGKWDTTQTVPSIIGEMCSVNLPNLDVLDEFCVPCSESSGSEISKDDYDCTIKQCSERVERVDFFESAPITAYSDRKYEHMNDAENNCDDNLSWLIHFKVGSLFNSDEVQQNHKLEGKLEETTCPGMY